MEQQRWQQLMAAFGFAPNLTTYQALSGAYAEPHRHYHTAAHIEAVLNHLDQLPEAPDCAKALELALWFHDAIYNPFSSTNERDSADWAIEFLQDNDASAELIQQVEQLIMITEHSAEPHSFDEQLMVDIDLTILGSDKTVYATFEKHVRREYQKVPYFIYRQKRKTILQSFLKRARIYQHEFFYSRFETQARANLQQAIAGL